jgi:hypothetical protein
MAAKDSQPQAYLSAFVPPALRLALEESAQQNDRSLSAELRQAIRSYVSDAGSPVGGVGSWTPRL